MPSASEIRVKARHLGVYNNTFSVDPDILKEASGGRNPITLAGKTIEEQLAIANKTRSRRSHAISKSSAKKIRHWEL